MVLKVPQREDCPFCRNVAREVSAASGAPAVVFEDDLTFVFMSPVALGGMEGHLTVIPRRHVETIFDVHTDEMAALGLCVQRAARAVRAAFDPDGVLVIQRNGVAAEQTVPHMHFHVIARRDGTPFPPSEWVERTPADERELMAQRVRSLW